MTSVIDPIEGLEESELQASDGLTFFMRGQAKDLTPDIHGREIAENSKVVGAKNLLTRIIWPRVESKGVYDVAFTDDSPIGMSAETMAKLGNVLDRPTADGKTEDNFNWGVRLTALALAHYVIFVSSFRLDSGKVKTNLTLLVSNGKLAAKVFKFDGADPSKVISDADFQKHFPEIIEHLGFDPIEFHKESLSGKFKVDHKKFQSPTGTTVFLVNSVKHEHTLLGSHGINRGLTRGNSGNLNKRLWAPEMTISFPEIHKVDVETWPKTEEQLKDPKVRPTGMASSQFSRVVKGAKEWIIEDDAGVPSYVGGDTRVIPITSGPLAGGEIWWALRTKVKDGDLAAYNGSGYMAILNQNELFHHIPSSSYGAWRQWGMGEKDVRSRGFLIIKPPARDADGDNGVRMNPKRTELVWMDHGVPRDISEVYNIAADAFRSIGNFPVEIREAMAKARGNQEFGDDTEEEAAKQRFLSRHQPRLKRARLRTAAGGSLSVNPVDDGGAPKPSVSPTLWNYPNLPGGGKGGMGGEKAYGPEAPPGEGVPGEEFLASGDLPHFSTTKSDWDEDWIIATFDATETDSEGMPLPTVFLNVAHDFVVQAVSDWIEDAGVDGWPDGEDAMKHVVYSAYRDILWGCVSQARDQQVTGLTLAQVKEKFLSDESLSTACTGYAHIDALVGSRKGPALSKLGKRPAAA